jgi:hypothetical protein
VRWDLEVNLVPEEITEHRDSQDPPAKKANPAQLAPLVWMEDTEHPVAMDAMGLLVHEENLAQLANRDHKAPEAFQEQLAFLAQRDIVETLVPPVLTVKTDEMAIPDHKVHKVNLVH